MNQLPKLNCDGHSSSDYAQNAEDYTKLKKQLYRQNSNYMRRHPELRAIIRVYLHEVINKQPKNIYEFSAALFNCNNSPLLVTKINEQLNWINRNLKQSLWSKYDGEMFFAEFSSTHSLLSNTSLANDVDNILRYTMVTTDNM